MNLPFWLLGVLMVGGAVALSVLGLWVVRRTVPPAALREHHDVAGFILAIVGVIYAVLLAFVLLVVWEQFEDARVVSEHEANALVDIYRMAPGFSVATAAPLRAGLKAYAQSVVQDEWTAMQSGASDDRTARRLDALWTEMVRLKPVDARQSALYDQSLSRLTEVSDNRRLRLLACRNGIPGPLWLVLILGAVATMLFTYFFGLERFVIQSLMTGILAATMALVLLVISGLNFPFSGDMRVQPEAMESVLRRFDDIENHEKTADFRRPS